MMWRDRLLCLVFIDVEILFCYMYFDVCLCSYYESLKVEWSGIVILFE